MKRLINLVSLITLTMLILGACNMPGDTSTPTEAPQAATTEAPTATEAPVVPTATAVPTLFTVDLAGPLMVVGSKYTYVDGTVLVAVPGGPFLMGYNFADNPEREVTVGDFWIYSTKVTNDQYALCVQLGKCDPPKEEDSPTYGDSRFVKFPVTGVTHTQASAYCSFVHGRLPTEAEWEKTARGPDGNLFPWGNGAPSCTLLNYKFCKSKTSWVNEYKDGVSYYSAFDMSGNVREWVADWYDPTYNVDSPQSDPLGPEIGEKRSVRGSSYQDSADPSLSAHRFSLGPEETLPDLGFRCVVEDPTYFAAWCEQLTYFGTSTDGSQPDCTPSVNCNDVSVSQAPNCTTNFQSYTIVTFNVANNPPDSATYDVPGCTQDPQGDGSLNKYLCNPGVVGPASITGSCQYDAPSGCSACPANYKKDGDKCVWDGSSTGGVACLPGSTFDPLTQCCSAIPAAGNEFGLCPAGSYPLNGACVADPKAVVESVVQSVLFDSCAPPPVTHNGGDDPGGGNPSGCADPGTCQALYLWDSSKCMCCGGVTNFACYVP